MRRAVITGGRVGLHVEFTLKALGEFLDKHLGEDDIEFAHGNAPGIDRLISEQLLAQGFTVHRLPIDHRLDGVLDDAPRRRNGRLLEWLKAGERPFLLAFPGGPGTRHMFDIAWKAKIDICDVDIDPFNRDEPFSLRWIRQ